MEEPREQPGDLNQQIFEHNEDDDVQLPVQAQVLFHEDLDEFEMMVDLPFGVRARIGLNETGLTRALARGDFSLAEKIIEESTDPEYLNDGALAATPLNMVLTGRSSFFHQSRNLKLAMLLMTKGANPNLRIPNHDMETASESPLELLLRYYVKLTEVFGLPGSGFCRTSYRPNSFEETELMDTVGINGEIGGLGPGQITAQARQLLLYCLEHGGDPNLPTTDAAKSVYHLALIAARPDLALLTRMLELGANVNLADVHNTTPLMDVISLGDEARSRRELRALQASGRTVLLDSQNCSLQSAVWRAMYQGQVGLVADLVEAQSNTQQCVGSGARVELVSRTATGNGPRLRLFRQPTIKFGVPSLLAPFLADSPVTANLHVRLPRRRYGRNSGANAHEYSALAALHVSRTLVAPIVDRGWLQGHEVTCRVATLVRLNTAHQVAGDATVVDTAAVVPLMFGELTAGLRQLAVRAILRHVLFSRSPTDSIALLDSVCKQSGFGVAGLPVAPSGTRLRGDVGGNILRQDYELELGDEVELSYTDTTLGEVAESAEIRNEVQDESPSVSVQRLEEAMERTELRIANLDDSVDDVEDMSEILDTLDKLDRELEVIRTDSVLQALDRDLANWEVELEATLSRITRYQEELRTLQLPGCPVARRRDACRAFGAEEARRRSEQLMEELRSQKNLLLRSDIDIATTEAMINSRQQQEEEQVVPQGIEDLVQSMESIQMEGDLLQVRLEHRSEEDRLDTARRRLDENWSLGSCRGLDETSSLARNFSRDVPNNENDSSSSSPAIQPGLVSPQHTTDRLVRSLQVSVSVRAPPRPPVRASSLPSPPRPVTAASSSSSDEAWSQSWSQDTTTTASPRTMASNLVSLNSRLFQQRRRIGAAAVALVEAPATPPPANIPASDLAWLQLNPEDPTPFVDPDEEAITEDEESSLSSESSSDSDGTWGGTFSLRHTQSLRPSQSPPPGDASVVSRLTARTLTAVTDSLGVPEMLRPCFALEAARLQLTLALATHQSIGCDRNCEGEESDSDSESDWLASETDTDDDTAEEVEDQDEDARNSQSEADRDDASDDVAGGSELSDFSQRSWFVSQPDLGAPRVRPLSPSFSPPLTSSPTHSATSSSSWLPDSEDLRRMRQFLATDLDKVTDFNRSTASESEDD